MMWRFAGIACCSATVGFTRYQMSEAPEINDFPVKNNIISIVDESLKKKLFNILNQKKEECGAPGMSFSIHKNGICLIKGGIGLADVENNAPCTKNTIMRIASISKCLASCAVGNLVDEGLLELDTPIQHYIPSLNSEQSEITTRQLLNHTSCIRGYFTKEKCLKNASDTKPRFSPLDFDENYLKKHFNSVEESMQLFINDPLSCTPGSEFNYSSHAYTLLSHVIENVTSHEFTVHMRGMLDGMQLKNTRVDLHENILPNRASHYMRDIRGRLKRAPYVDNSYKWAGAGYLSNVEDLVRFGELMLSSYQHPNGFLSQQTMKELWDCIIKSNRGYSYGLGWQINENSAPRIAYHTGLAVGASSILMVVPESIEPSESYHKIVSRGKPVTNEIEHRGIVIAIMVNMNNVGLTHTSRRLVEEIENNN